MESAEVKKYLLVIIMACFCAPVVLMLMPVKTLELAGVTEPVVQPTLTSGEWLSGSFQEKFDGYFSFNAGLRKMGVRTGNQINYWLGEQMNAAIVGKQHELMGKEYIESYYGKDFIGLDSVRLKVSSLAKFKQALNEKGIPLFIVIAPSKTRLYPGRIPDDYRKVYSAQTNYDAFIKELKAQQIDVINLQEWFEVIDGQSPAPLFSNLGVHWSQYSATFCTDSIIGHIGKVTGKNVNRIKFNKIVLSSEAYGTDKDLAEVMNMWYPVQLERQLGYFEIELPVDSSKAKPSVLTVGDSYYWNMIYTTAPANYFAPGSCYYYYNSKAYFIDGTEKAVKDLDVLQQVLSKDVVFLMYAEPNLKRLGEGIEVDFLNALQANPNYTVQK
jgi:hypothetical protein